METETVGTAHKTFEVVLERTKRLSALRQEKAQFESELFLAQRNVEALLKAGKLPADEFARINSQIKRLDEQISRQLAEAHAAFDSCVRELEEFNERAKREIVFPGRARLKSVLDEAADICESLKSSRMQIIERVKELDANRQILAVNIQEPFHNFRLSAGEFYDSDIPGIRREDHEKGSLEIILRSVSSQI
jgi:hypothetical protein